MNFLASNAQFPIFLLREQPRGISPDGFPGILPEISHNKMESGTDACPANWWRHLASLLTISFLMFFWPQDVRIMWGCVKISNSRECHWSISKRLPNLEEIDEEGKMRLKCGDSDETFLNLRHYLCIETRMSIHPRCRSPPEYVVCAVR